jgi:ribose transport system permease protein
MIDKSVAVKKECPFFSRDGLPIRLAMAVQKLGVTTGLIVLCVVASILSPAFLRPQNLFNVARQVSITGIVGVGTTFVILTGGIDLSVGSIIGLVAVVVAGNLARGMNSGVAIAIGLGIGALVGLINGIGVSKGKLQPFIMTLATMVMARGMALTISNGQPVSLKNAAERFAWLGAGNLGPIPVPVLVFTVVIIIAYVVLKYSFFGRYVYAIGGNSEAARLSGINVEVIQLLTYGISGLLAGLAALIWISRLTVGEPTAGTNVELDAIAMTVIGGTSLMGGEGSVLGTLVGALIIGVLANVLNLLGISPWSQQIFKGAIIIAAVLTERWRKR